MFCHLLLLYVTDLLGKLYRWTYLINEHLIRFSCLMCADLVQSKFLPSLMRCQIVKTSSRRCYWNIGYWFKYGWISSDIYGLYMVGSDNEQWSKSKFQRKNTKQQERTRTSTKIVVRGNKKSNRIFLQFL